MEVGPNGKMKVNWAVVYAEVNAAINFTTLVVHSTIIFVPKSFYLLLLLGCGETGE